MDRNNPDARQALKLERPYKGKEKKLPGTTLLKALVSYQFASRAASLKAINEDRIQINGVDVNNQNTFVKMDKDVLLVDGITLVRKTYKPIYLVFNKPRGVIGSKETGRLTTYSYLVNKRGWHIPSGALTKAASGVVLVTNDIRHKFSDATPLLDLSRDIYVKVHKAPKKNEITAISSSLKDALGEHGQHITVSLDVKTKRAAWLKIGMRRGSISLITVALKKAGFEVLAIERRRLGPFNTENMGPGAWYRLSDEEIAALQQLSKEKPENDSVPLQSFWKSISSKFFSNKGDSKS